MTARAPKRNAPGGYAAVTEPRRPSSHLVAAPLAELAAICATALARLEAAVLRGGSRPRGPLFQATERVTRVESIADQVEREQAAASSAQRQTQALAAAFTERKACMDRAIEETLVLAGTIAERGERLRLQRETGDQPTHAVEAFVWEIAALAAEEEMTRDRARMLAEESAVSQAEERERDVRARQASELAAAQREGTEAALRWATFEALIAIEESACESGLDENDIAGILEATQG